MQAGPWLSAWPPASLIPGQGRTVHVSKTVWEENPPKSHCIHRNLPHLPSFVCLHSAHDCFPSFPHSSPQVCSDWHGIEQHYLPGQRNLQQPLKEVTFGRSHPEPLHSHTEWNLLGGKWWASMVRGNLVPPDLPLPPALQVWGRQIEKPAVNWNIHCV